ncbi:glycosyltransferase family 2 protein [Chryseobacterium sp. PBS4-4]|uniref:Glycosyltransferase family 2 protein n=1 Tax=Chryseobacterium edaphi TaxID=2976532 RepID=A0ABT2W982_9FLAO|nr:glycosyltransferase family 2 protein [Chryseobacterium edaphi]MCU7617822.1 glycosyltransferase family 2 protein [Chryseobacterium edaphi]
MIKFSILIAHYNNYDYFKECYHSILRQTYQNYEIILVDDCSADESYQKIVALTKDDSKTKVFRNEENSGVGYTKRKCVEMASGEICGFVDPDDALVENALQISIENHIKNNVVTYSSFYLCDDQLKPIRTFQHSRAVKNNDKKFFNVFLEANHFFTFKKEAYDKTVGINSELTSAVDQDLYLKLYETGSFKFINIPLYFYRLHDKGVSQEASKKKKLNTNWHQVILESAKRRNIEYLYGKKIDVIENLPEFLKVKQNNIITKIIRKFL